MNDFMQLALDTVAGFEDNEFKKALLVSVDYFMKRTF